MRFLSRSNRNTLTCRLSSGTVSYTHLLPVEQLRDGKLHRFVWVADDGKAVRFFVINRYPDKLRFGVVFDLSLIHI